MMQIHSALNSVAPLPDQSLHRIVNDLIRDTAALAVHHRNYIVNNTPPDLVVNTNEVVVSNVLDKLFNVVTRNAHNSVILITARVYGMTVLVQVKAKGRISPALPEDLGYACSKAQKAGAIIEIIRCENENAELAFCFLNISAEA